jgi:HD-GYP domain-containing protein (c-di-GMP phosphodiesterase class II)
VRTEIRLSEVVAALSHALDITEGQPIGHAERCCRIGMRIGAAIDLPARSRSALFYALLLKDAGSSASGAQVAPAAETRLRRERGAEIARQIGLSAETAQAIRHVDERWDGSGAPDRLRGDDVPVVARILALAQGAEVAWQHGGPHAAIELARQRRGTWFDPALADVVVALSDDQAFWRRVLLTDVSDLEPEDRAEVADEGRLDDVAEAFASVIDAKSPFTSRHSQGVADIAGRIAGQLDLSAPARRDLRRAGLLHDIGKLGVSSRILDKPGPLDAGEWVVMRRHTEMTQRILEHVSAFGPLAATAAAHHERLDGRGYHRGVGAGNLPLAARILAVADVAEALGADRPYRPALSSDEVLALMREQVGSHFCPIAYEALEGAMSVTR